MTHTAPQIQSKTESEVRIVSVSFSGKLEDGEKLTGTPVIVESVSSDLTLDNKVVSTSILTINGVSVPIGEAVQFRVTGGNAGTTYDINISCGTDATPAQTLHGKIKLSIDAD